MSKPAEHVQPLSPALQSLADHLVAIRQDTSTLTNLTDTQWQWTPDGKHWSLVQCLDHLNKTGYAILPKFEAALAQLQTSGARHDGPFQYSLPERWFIRLLSPNPPFKSPVPPMLVPTVSGTAPTKVLADFLALQENLSRFVLAANGWDLRRARVVSPVTTLFRPCVGAYLEAAVAHERYHWLQVLALRADTGFPV